jgi:hypothetical protein
MLAWLLGAAGCLVDETAPCGADLVVGPTSACICPEDQVLQSGACRGCGNHARAVAGSCVCDRGYAKEPNGTACVESTPAADAVAADAGATDGGAPAADPSETLPDDRVVCDGGPCTSCESSADCAPGELCDLFGEQRCVPAPDGLGTPCSAAADCSQTSATYCELFSSRTCQIEGCKELSGVCPGDLVCCDYAILGTSLCIPSSEAPAGECPAPGSAVPRESSP